MRGDAALAADFSSALERHSEKRRRMPGVDAPGSREVLAAQLVESTHRVRYPSVIQARDIGLRRADPTDELFDPLLAAELARRGGYEEEACWLVFLFVHFGKNARGGWRYARQTYGRLGNDGKWDWKTTSQEASRFRAWLREHGGVIKDDPRPGGFGSHRKYQSLDAGSSTGTGAAVTTYVRWVASHGTHRELFTAALATAGGDGRRAFDVLYRSMEAVASFGRTARFDYLCMIGKLGIAPIEPGSPYLQGSTGPLAGARLLFGGTSTARIPTKSADAWVVELGASLRLGMQVMEDALCNWNKSPHSFRAFRG